MCSNLSACFSFLIPQKVGRQVIGDTQVLLVRGCSEAHAGEPIASCFRDWHSEEFQTTGRDPVLGETGYQAATTGVRVDDDTAYHGCRGLKGGLQGLLVRFDPQLVVCSPMSTCLTSLGL